MGYFGTGLLLLFLHLLGKLFDLLGKLFGVIFDVLDKRTRRL